MGAPWSSPAAMTAPCGCGTRPSGTPVGVFTGHKDGVFALALSQLDGRTVVVSGAGDGTILVWDAATGALVGDPLTGHTGMVNAVAVGRLNGRATIASASYDRTVRVWDAATGFRVGSPITGPHRRCVRRSDG